MQVSLEEYVIQFISLCEDGRFLEAVERFYDEDAIVQENNEPPRIGRAAQAAHERNVPSRIREIHLNRAASFLVDGDRAAINWVYEYTGSDGLRHRLDEIAYQQWGDGRIVRERFFYDPEQRRVAIEAPADSRRELSHAGK